jgi:hypothetical protein
VSFVFASDVLDEGASLWASLAEGAKYLRQRIEEIEWGDEPAVQDFATQNDLECLHHRLAAASQLWLAGSTCPRCGESIAE